MISFPNCKINLGLFITNKRADGYHALQTVFYPISWCDALEVVESTDSKPFHLSTSGLIIPGEPATNLLFKTWQLITNEFNLPPISVHLHKNIPMGAGLGGGSADVAFFIKLLDEKFNLGISDEKKLNLASQIGSDCAFFIKNRAVYAEGRGDEFSNINVDLSQYYILIVFPHIHVNTKDAFAGLSPKMPKENLNELIARTPIEKWHTCLFNDFEPTILEKHPAIKQIKNAIYQNGAIYASMSGSGSAVYGVFEKEPSMFVDKKYSFYLHKPALNIL
jgi:4-diphosphocytidyl-2-C-methyl-D-erythritol kinase